MEILLFYKKKTEIDILNFSFLIFFDISFCLFSVSNVFDKKWK